MSNDTDHAARFAGIQGRFIRAKMHGPCTAADVEFQQNSMLDVRYLLDRVRELEAYRHALEQRLIGSNLDGLTGNADADLMRFVFHEQDLALSPEVGTIAELRDALTVALARAERAEAERDTLRAEVARLGPVEWWCDRGGLRGERYWAPCDLGVSCDSEHRIAIRVVQPQEGQGDE